MATRTPAFVLLPALLGGAACTGPALHIDNPERHPVFVDGVAVPRAQAAPTTTLPFRYYGTTRWDAVPAEREGRSDFTHRPASESVVTEPPLTGWLFPLDFPVDLVSRLLHGRGDATATVRVTPTPPSSRAEPDSAKANADALRERARLARVSR